MQGKILTTINPTQYSNLAKGLTLLKNPNKEWGTLLIEVPADIGRAYSGYKRGGVIEGAEKFRKDMISGLVWLFGIPLFNKGGNFLFEKIFKLPMDIDYDEATIRRSLKFIADNQESCGLDTSDLAKYGKQFAENINKLNIDTCVKRVKGAKQIISIGSWALNCFLMGIALPKINQAITRNKLKKENKATEGIKDFSPKFETMKEFQEKTKKDKNVSFTGLANWFTYGINNNSRFRLISTDVPMIMGRCATARNKYEALEIGLMDSAAILFYNFTLGWTQSLLSKLFGSPLTNAKIAECLTSQNQDDLANAINSAKTGKEIFRLSSFFDKDVIDEIYKQGTNGKYNKINRFIKKEEIEEIDNSIISLLKYIGGNEKAFKDGKVNIKEAQALIKKMNLRNGAFYILGTIVSVFGLGVLIPKVVYAITKKITGKDGFIGIEETDKK